MSAKAEGRPADAARRRVDITLIIGIALAKLTLNVVFHGRYGYFRDELYYIACSDHLDWGYVDHPPLSIAILALTRLVLGDSLYGIRFTAALAGAATVVLTGLMARRLGGSRFSQLLAAGAVALSPVVLGNAARYYSMNAFDLLFWAAGSYVLLLIVQGGSGRLWILYGLIAGLGVMNKYSMLFFGAGTAIGLLLTLQRRDLLRPWIWIGGLAAAVIVSPHAFWEFRHGFPTAEFIHNASTLKNAPISPGGFMQDQIMMTGIGQTLLWLLGLGFFFLKKGSGRIRVFGWMYPAVAAIMIAGNSKAYYLTPIYFPYVAAGAVSLEAIAATRAWMKGAVTAVLILFSLISLPFTIPVLPAGDFIRYQRFLHQNPRAEERSSLGELPQYYADMFGWEPLVEQIAGVYRRLTPEEQRHCVIFVRNYGEAAAVDFFGKRHGLPPALCGHNSYWYWGPGNVDMRVAIIIGDSYDLQENLGDLSGPGRFKKAELAATTRCALCMPYENGRMIFLCRGPAFTFAQIWPDERGFI